MACGVISIKTILKISFDSYFGGAYSLCGGKTLPYRALTEQVRLEILKQCKCDIRLALWL